MDGRAVADLSGYRALVVSLLGDVFLPLEVCAHRLDRVPLHGVLSHVRKGHVVTPAADLEDRLHRLFLLGQERPVLVLPHVGEGHTLHGVCLLAGLRGNRDLHPGGSKNGRLCTVVSLALPFEWFAPVHAVSRNRDPALVLAHDRDHPLRLLDLIPRVLHQAQIVRDLALVLALL